MPSLFRAPMPPFIRRNGVTALLSAMVAAAAGTAAAGEPECRVPRAAKAPTLDGRLASGEWTDAAVVRRFRTRRHEAPDSRATAVFLKYDDAALYVGLDCPDDDPLGPVAHPRDWNDLLFDNDDAFLVVLGLVDPVIPVREKIDMGGYEGAMDGEAASAGIYYTYGVNAANSRQRLWNETPLPTALFDSAVQVRPGKGWTAELRIPFAGFGLDRAPEGKTLDANLFRCRAPGMTGWHYPQYGGYSPMPFGRFVFLAKGKEGEATRETAPESPRAAAAKPRLELSLRYAPLNGCVVGSVEHAGQADTLSMVLEVAGLPPATSGLADNARDIDHDGRPVRTAFKTSRVWSDFPPGSQPERSAVLRVVDGAGQTVAEKRETWPAVTAPEWFGTDAGREFVEDAFPAPWTPAAVRGREVELLDKTIEFSEAGLPASIRFHDALRGELLAAPVRVEVSAGGKPLDFSRGEVEVRQHKVSARVDGAAAAAGGPRLETRLHLEPDGFMEVRCRVRGVAAGRIDRVRLVVPLRRETDRFLMRENLTQRIAQLLGPGYRDAAGPLWAGSRDKGVHFSFDASPFLSRDLRRQMTVEETPDATVLAFTFVDAAGQMDGDTIFRFFLLPTPTKPMPESRVRELEQVLFEGWSDHHGYPNVDKIPSLQPWVEKTKAEGKLPMLYTCQGLQADTPDFLKFRSDLEMLPAWRYYRHRGVDCFAASKRGPEGDLQLWGWERLIREGGVRGMISDGMFVPWNDSNPAHRVGGGRPQPVVWDGEMKTRVTGQRDFLKRMRGLFTKTGEPFVIDNHTGGGLDPTVLSFTDGYRDGEQLARFNRGYIIPPAIFAIGYTGHPWGWRASFWPKNWRGYRGVEAVFAYALLFGVESRGNPFIENEKLDLDLYRQYAPPGSSFLPFWKDNPFVRLDSGLALATTYLSDGRALVVVSNLRERDASYALDLANLFPGRAVRVRELLSARDLGATRRVEGALLPVTCDLIVVETTDSGAEAAAADPKPANVGEPAPPEPFRPFDLAAYDAADWRVNTHRDGVEADFARQLAGGRTGLAFHTRPGAPAAARAEFKRPFGRDLYVDLDIRLTRRFRVFLGPVALSHGPGYTGRDGWFMRGPAQWRGQGRHFRGVPVTDAYGQSRGRGLRNSVLESDDEFGRLQIGIRDRVMDVVYKDMVVFAGVPLDIPDGENVLAIETWHDNEIAFTVNRLSTTPETLVAPPAVRHPVLELP